jgi:hypothetical protein
MSNKTIQTTSESTKGVQAAIDVFARKLAGARARRSGAILLRLTGEGGGDYYVHTANEGCTMSRQAGLGPHHFEIIGDAHRVCAVLDGTKEGRKQFFEGGVRIRGNLRYLSTIFHEMGLINERF